MARRAARESLFMVRPSPSRLARALPESCRANLDGRADRPRPRVVVLALPAAARALPLPPLEVGALARAAADRQRLAADPPRRRARAARARRGVRPPAVRPARPAARRARRPRRPGAGQRRVGGDRRGDRLARAARAGAPGLLVALDRVADQPEHRRPQAYEQRPPLGVAALVLVDGLRPDPQADAQPDTGHRGAVEVVAAQADVMQLLREHATALPAGSTARCPAAPRSPAG